MNTLFKSGVYTYHTEGNRLLQSFTHLPSLYREMKRKDVRRVTGNRRWWHRRTVKARSHTCDIAWHFSCESGCLKIGCVEFTKEQTDILRNWANGAS